MIKMMDKKEWGRGVEACPQYSVRWPSEGEKSVAEYSMRSWLEILYASGSNEGRAVGRKKSSHTLKMGEHRTAFLNLFHT